MGPTAHWSVISAVNNEQILKSCLLRSPDLGSATDVILQTGFSSAASAYNSGMQQANGNILIFVHQDVYLPEGWFSCAQTAIEAISDRDPNWGVLGVWGVRHDGTRAGYLYWTGIEKATAGNQFEGGIEVETLDELLLIVRRSSGLAFDERLKGFHMYGADICLEARKRGMKSYAISAFCIHNTNQYRMLPLVFWRAYFFIRKKWKTYLPIKASCTEVTRLCWPMIRWNIVRAINLVLRREKISQRIPDPSYFYREFVRPKLVPPSTTVQVK